MIEQAQNFFEQNSPERKVKFGMRIDILARPTQEQAFQELKQMYETIAVDSNVLNAKTLNL